MKKKKKEKKKNEILRPIHYIWYFMQIYLHTFTFNLVITAELVNTQHAVILLWFFSIAACAVCARVCVCVREWCLDFLKGTRVPQQKKPRPDGTAHGAYPHHKIYNCIGLHLDEAEKKPHTLRKMIECVCQIGANEMENEIKLAGSLHRLGLRLSCPTVSFLLFVTLFFISSSVFAIESMEIPIIILLCSRMQCHSHWKNDKLFGDTEVQNARTYVKFLPHKTKCTRWELLTHMPHAPCLRTKRIAQLKCQNTISMDLWMWKCVEMQAESMRISEEEKTTAAPNWSPKWQVITILWTTQPMNPSIFSRTSRKYAQQNWVFLCRILHFVWHQETHWQTEFGQRTLT